MGLEALMDERTQISHQLEETVDVGERVHLRQEYNAIGEEIALRLRTCDAKIAAEQGRGCGWNSDEHCE